MENEIKVTGIGTEAEALNTVPNITVTWSTLVEGIGLTFSGITKMLTALDPHMTKIIAQMVEEEQRRRAESDPAQSDAEQHEGKSAEQKMTNIQDEVLQDPEIPMISLDDVTKVIVQKIRQNRSNNEKIGAILKTYGVCKVSELQPAKYEAFLTDLAQL